MKKYSKLMKKIKIKINETNVNDFNYSSIYRV